MTYSGSLANSKIPSNGRYGSPVVRWGFRWMFDANAYKINSLFNNLI